MGPGLSSSLWDPALMAQRGRWFLGALGVDGPLEVLGAMWLLGLLAFLACLVFVQALDPQFFMDPLISTGFRACKGRSAFRVRIAPLQPSEVVHLPTALASAAWPGPRSSLRSWRYSCALGS